MIIMEAPVQIKYWLKINRYPPTLLVRGSKALKLRSLLLPPQAFPRLVALGSHPLESGYPYTNRYCVRLLCLLNHCYDVKQLFTKRDKKTKKNEFFTPSDIYAWQAQLGFV